MEIDVLTREGHRVQVYAQYTDEHFGPKVITKKQALQMLRSPNTRVLYHHSIEWKIGEELFDVATGPIIFRYHNVTPEEFLFDDPVLQNQVIMARWQTQKFIDSGKITQYLNASPYNSRELIQHGANPDLDCSVAPFHRINDFASCEEDPELKKQLQEKDAVKILFVGRIMRHKGQHHLIQLVGRYVDLYGPKVHLYLVGKVSTRRYTEEIARTVNVGRLGAIVRVHHRASFRELNTYYKNCDVFCCLSEHEGFGVPILEAQYHKIPIVALRRTAIEDTIGPNQLLIDDLDFDHFSAAIKSVSEHRDYRRFLIEAGTANNHKYENEVLAKAFVKAATRT
jgi:glycosyltransferase involved in cell wall biosynthesis